MSGGEVSHRSEGYADEYELRIRIRCADDGASFFAYLDQPHDLAGGWSSTPEAALIALCDKARKRRRELGNSTWKSVEEDGLTPLYVALSRAGLS